MTSPVMFMPFCKEHAKPSTGINYLAFQRHFVNDIGINLI
jgi:hypothetical protein